MTQHSQKEYIQIIADLEEKNRDLTIALKGLLIEAEVSLGHMDEKDEIFCCSERIKWAKEALEKSGAK